MLSPLMGVAGVNSLLFGAFSVAKRIITPFPDLSIQQIALAGSMAGAANSVLASPGDCHCLRPVETPNGNLILLLVELFKIRMQGQYGGVDDKRLSRVARDMWREWGFRHGVMRGFWACFIDWCHAPHTNLISVITCRSLLRGKYPRTQRECVQDAWVCAVF